MNRGVTFLAYGNGAPDVFSAVTAFSGHRGGSAAGLAFNSLLGRLIFFTVNYGDVRAVLRRNLL